MENKIRWAAFACLSILTFGTVLITFNLDFRDTSVHVSLNNTTCTQTHHIGRKLFLHVCTKENKTVFDLRYFWQEADDDLALKASIIGVQMPMDEFLKVCNVCSSHQ